MDICIEKYMDICIEKYMDICMEKYMDICMEKYMDICTEKYMNICMEKYMDICTEKYMNICMEKYMDICMEKYMDICMESLSNIVSRRRPNAVVSLNCTRRTNPSFHFRNGCCLFLLQHSKVYFLFEVGEYFAVHCRKGQLKGNFSVATTNISNPFRTKLLFSSFLDIT